MNRSEFKQHVMECECYKSIRKELGSHNSTFSYTQSIFKNYNRSDREKRRLNIACKISSFVNSYGYCKRDIEKQLKNVSLIEKTIRSNNQDLILARKLLTTIKRWSSIKNIKIDIRSKLHQQIEFFEEELYLKEILDLLDALHNYKLKNEEDIKFNNLNAGNFKSISNVFKSNIGTPSCDYANLVIAYLKIDIPYFKKETVTFQPYEKTLISKLKHTYSSNEDFIQIRTIGNFNNTIPALSMDEYYMDLESVEEQSKSQRYSNKEAYDYIFSNNNRIVITGNPGCGKSTFAKWLCYYWAKHDNDKLTIPLYIDLSEIKTYNFCFDEYFTATYKIKKENLESILQSEINVRFILDGLDEISELDKTELNIRLRKIDNTIHTNYVLLSRSYSLVYSKFPTTPNLNLIGFNNTSREIYLEKISRLFSNNDIYFKNFNEQIKKQDTLQDLFNNPLILSFVIQIFLNDPNFYSNFSTKYQIYNWILNRNVKHEIENHRLDKKEWYNLHSKICRLSFELLLDNQSSYTSDMLNEYHESVILLSKIGFGNLIELEDKKWRFKFHSVTTQEFLAAKHLSEHLQIRTIKYLLKFKKFEELLSMTIECDASYPEVKKFLSKTIQLIDVNPKKQKAFFLIVSYLSEQNLNLYWNHKNLHKLFVKSYSNEVSRFIFRIYRKLNNSNREYITNLILNTLKSYLQVSQNNENNTQQKKISSLMHGIARSKFYKDSMFFSQGLPFVLEILNTYFNKLINNEILKELIYDFSQYHIEKDTMKLPTEKIKQIIGKDRYASMYYSAKINTDSNWVYNEIERIKADDFSQPHISSDSIRKIQSLVWSLAKRNIESTYEDKKHIYNYIFSIFKLLKSLKTSRKTIEINFDLSAFRFAARKDLEYIDTQIELEYISYSNKFNILTKEEDIDEILNLCYNKNKVKYIHIIQYFINNYKVRNIPPKHADLYIDNIEHETIITTIMHRAPLDKKLHKKMLEKVSISECIRAKNMLPDRYDHIIEFEPKYFDEIIDVLFHKVSNEDGIWQLFRFLACIKLSFFLRNKNKVMDSWEKSLSLLTNPTGDILDALFNFLTLIIETKSKLPYPFVDKINQTLEKYKRTNYLTKYFFKAELNITHFPCNNCRIQPCEYYNKDGFGCELFEYEEAFEYEECYGEVNLYLACVFLMDIIQEKTIQSLKIENLTSNIRYIDSLFNILSYTYTTASTKDLEQLLGESFKYYDNYNNLEHLDFNKAKLLKTLK
ncbi:NACHT domain-containing protein [Marinifilum fragile]|uniref:NACHT domain-containing protein n=1 Tax=Marinifilum fragile TaxID=570161 RepID=UPI002AA73507|nr:NACHT domain-containing protein [Marinifilum fragile]